MKYPFKEGDDYFVIESDGTLTYSCWDDISEEMHTPSEMYLISTIGVVNIIEKEGSVQLSSRLPDHIKQAFESRGYEVTNTKVNLK